VFALAFGLLIGWQGPTICANPWLVIDAAMLLLVAVSAKAFELAEVELGAVTVMRFAVVDDGCGSHEVDSEATLAKRLAPELVTAKASPSPIVVGAASVVAALATTFGMQTDEGIGAHERQTIQPASLRNQPSATQNLKPRRFSKTFYVELVVRV